MLNNCKEVQVGDKVVNDGLCYQEMTVVRVPVRTAHCDFVECEWEDASGQLQKDIFFPEQLSFFIINSVDSRYLNTLFELFEDAFSAGTDQISLHYFAKKNKYESYCLENVSINNCIQSFGGIGEHVRWLKCYQDGEITSLLGKRFFDGENVRLVKIGTHKYAMEYWY